MGIRRWHYHSDMTRTVVTGSPPKDRRYKDIYSIVLDAQSAAFEILRPGVSCREVDAAARNVIDRAGYGANFGHGLGHGVGLEIHEEPRLNPRSTQQLEPGMVVSVEPGIYIPGFGGVRIEDLVVVTKNGFQNLNSSSKRFRCIDWQGSGKCV